MKKQICIMAKSLKDHGYCVAGVDLGSGAWVRLVSSRDGGQSAFYFWEQNGRVRKRRNQKPWAFD